MVSLFAVDEVLLRRRLRWLQGRVGKVELRLDHLPDDLDLRALREDFPHLEWFAACRVPTAGESRRERLLRAAEAGFDGVDFPLEDGAPPQLPEGVRRILSWHQQQAAEVDLEAVYRQLLQLAAPEDLIKIVAWADYAEQSWPVLELYRDAPPESLLAFAQGPGGAASRVLALRCGAPWIYSSWPGEATAPGQWDVVQLLDFLPQSLDLETPALGVLGNPVAHSLSPFLWQAALRSGSATPSALYLPFPVQDLAAFLAGARRHAMTAFSVTSPHKQEAFQIAAEQAGPLPGALGAAATACAAANLLCTSDGGWQAGNSDGVGAMEVLQEAGLEAGSGVLLLGAGGAARAVAVEALRRGHHPTLASRRPMDPPGVGMKTAALDAVDLADFDAVVQATPVGSVDSPGMLCVGRPPRAAALALDMVYHPLHTAWLRVAADAGATPLCGTGMLLQQMIAQFHQVFGKSRPTPDAKALGQELGKHLEERQAVVLIGARAAGKTTLGERIAQFLDWDFLDADEVLVARSGKSIETWLQDDLEGFRALEAEILQELLARPFLVLATGGGVVERAESLHRLQDASRVVWLRCSVEELLRRQQQAPRPSFGATDLRTEIEQLLARREQDYRRAADLVISTNDAVEETVDQVVLHFGLQGIVLGFR